MINHHISHHLNRKNIELNEIYVSMSLRTFAISLVSIFIPIYLYNLGYSLRDIFLYYALVCLFKAFGEPFSGKAVSNYGAKRILAISFPIMALSFVFFLTLNAYHWPVWVLSLVTAIPLSLFWLPYHDDFSKAKHKKTAGKEVGKLTILVSVFGALGPILGGVIAQEMGLQVAILITTVLLLLAMIPLFGSSEITEKRPLDLKQFSIRKNMRDMISYGGFGLEVSSATIIWPLFLFLLVENYIKVGSITTVALLAMIAFALFIGNMTDKYERRKVLRVSGVVDFFAAGSRIMATSLNSAYVIGIISSISHILLYVPFTSIFYTHADKEPRAEYMVGMEMSMDMIRAFGFGVLCILTYFLSTREVLIAGIIMGAIGTFLSTNIARPSRKEKFNLQEEMARAQ